MKIHVGNLSAETKIEDLQKAFETYGTVTRVRVVKDKETGVPKGFAFVEMPTSDEGTKAIAGMHEQDLNGQAITVREARKKGEPRPNFSG
jgi:RNA recognition motif-containing protein